MKKWDEDESQDDINAYGWDVWGRARSRLAPGRSQEKGKECILPANTKDQEGKRKGKGRTDVHTDKAG